MHGVPRAALEFEGEGLARWLAADAQQDQVRLRRLPLAFPCAAPRFADVWIGTLEGGGWLLEAHPVDASPGEDQLAGLPPAAPAAPHGFAHELSTPLPWPKCALRPEAPDRHGNGSGKSVQMREDIDGGAA